MNILLVSALICLSLAEGQQCPKNETYSECGNNGCQNTCENPNIAMVCRAMCVSGCVCAEGHLRNARGHCVLAPECCDSETEIYTECDNTCINTCDNPELKFVCFPPGCMPGCICKVGLLRNDDGKCVPKKDCKEIICDEGFIKGPAGKCIRSDFGCGSKEEYAFSPEVTCDSHFNGGLPPCPNGLNDKNCGSGCRCLSDYVRNDQDDCVPPEECCSDPHSHLVTSPNPCSGGTCEKPAYDLCALRTPRYGCVCKDGYVKRSDLNATCILKESCPIIKATKVE